MVATSSGSSGETNDRAVALDPRARVFLRMLEIWRWPPTPTRTPRQARHDLRILHAATGSWRPVRDIRDAMIPGPGGKIPVRVYRPGRRGETDRPLVVYFHGGGFVIGDLFTADGACRRLANAAGATVVSVHYRRAPEHALPAAQEDAYAATRWVQEHASQLGADPGRLVVAGDSAGGGLAAHVAQRLRDDGPAPAALQVLVNPGLDFSLEHIDRDPALARLLDGDTIEWFAAHAVPRPVDRTDPRISPSRAPDLTGLPPAVVITAGVDPFRQDAVHYVQALESAGVPVEWHDFPGQLHGFTDMDLVFPAARDSLRRIAAAVRRAIAVEVPAYLASDERIPWTRPHGGLLRRLREDAQRLPQVNGPEVVCTLLAARLTSVAARLQPSADTSGGARP